MTRAKRHYTPGHVWHITHRCHKREFLLKFPRDRRRWIEWLYQAKKRYSGLSVLNYMATSNHVHLLAFDHGGRNVIPDSIKLVAGRTGQEYNARKNRKRAEVKGKENKWTQSIAVGSKPFIEKMKSTLGFRAKGRKVLRAEDSFERREALMPYGTSNGLDSENTFLWDQPSPSLISQFSYEN